MIQHTARPARRVLTLLVALAVLLTAAAGLAPTAKAAGGPTSLGLAEHGIMAYEDEWLYNYGSKGETNSEGVRMSDCAGLIYAYFKDLGQTDGLWGNVNNQVKYNCVFSGDIDELDGLPRIPGLVLTVPDYYNPETGIYSHIGIYIGNNMATDNSDYGTNMVMAPVVGANRGWTAWHVFDQGALYASNGWYAYNGYLYHFTDCQYDVDTTVDGIAIGSDGIAVDAGGQPIDPYGADAPALSQCNATASQVAQILTELGYSGSDSTGDLVDPGLEVPAEEEFNGRITGNGVSLREEPRTNAPRVATLYRNDRVVIAETVDGEMVQNSDGSSDQWCAVVTETGRSGYVSALYVEHESALEAPAFSVEDGALVITAGEGADIRYTTDGSRPTSTSTPYTGPIHQSGSYLVVAVQDEWTSPMVSVTFAGGALFTDFTSEDWYFTHIDRAVELGLFSGSGNQAFQPTQVITRAQFAAALANLAGVDTSAYQGATAYNDVSAGAWYSGHLNWVTQQGIMSGIGGGAFWPDEPITREQICVAVANYAGLSSGGSSGAFADDGSIHSWAKDAVYACRDLGIISGMGENRFAPLENAQRAQACAIILNTYDQGL